MTFAGTSPAKARQWTRSDGRRPQTSPICSPRHSAWRIENYLRRNYESSSKSYGDKVHPETLCLRPLDGCRKVAPTTGLAQAALCLGEKEIQRL